MRIWVDGGTLHSAHRCLLGLGAPEDADNLLHLASCLPFAEEVLIGSYGGGTYSQMSQEAILYLNERFDTGRIIREVPVSATLTEEIYLSAATTIAMGIDSKLSRVHAGDAYPFLDHQRMDMETLFYNMIKTDMPDSARHNLYEQVKNTQNSGLIVMLAKNDEFWSATRKLVREYHGWSDDNARRLATACRAYIHVQAAKKFSSVYSPNAHRGASMMPVSTEGFPGALWRKIQCIPNEVVKDLPKLSLPPFAAYVALKSNGDPEQAIRAAIALRETKASPLLHCLKIIYERLAKEDDPSLDINRDYEKLIADLKVYMVKSTRGQLVSAAWAWVKPVTLLVNAVLSGTVELSSIPSSLMNAARQSRQLGDLQNVIALGDMSAHLRWAGENDQPYHELRRAASKNM